MDDQLVLGYTDLIILAHQLKEALDKKINDCAELEEFYVKKLSDEREAKKRARLLYEKERDNHAETKKELYYEARSRRALKRKYNRLKGGDGEDDDSD